MLRTTAAALGLFALLAALPAQRASAQESRAVAAATASPTVGPAAASAPSERRMTMTEQVTAADFRQIEGGPLLLAAYAVVWIVFFVVLLYTLGRLRRVSEHARRIELQLASHDERG